MGVYTGNSVTNLTGVQECSGLPVLNFDVTAGTVYQIAVDSAYNFFGNPTGPFTLNLALAAPVVRPPNDNFENRTAITGANLMITASNTNATTQFDEPNPGGSPGMQSVWWKWTAPATGRVTIDATSSTTPQLIGVYSGTVLTNLTVVGAGLTTNSFDAVAGESYDIDFAAWEGNGNPGYGQVIFGLTEQLAASNDDFSNRIVLVGTNLTVTGDNTGASHEPGESNHNTICSHSLWYSWTAPANGSLVVTSSSSVMYAFNQLYTGTTMASLVNATPDPTMAGAYEVTAGTTYQIDVDSGGYQFGAFTLSLQLTPRPVNDAFANRIPITGNLVHLQASNIGATREFGERLPPNAQGDTIWWAWTPTVSGNVTITGASTFSPILTFYTGSSVATLTPVTGPLVAGTPYQISLDGYQNGEFGPVGSVDYWLSLPGPPPNDNFASRQVYIGTTNLAVGLITYATSEAGEPNYLGEGAGKSVWYSWTAPASARYLISAAASDFGPQSVIAVYTGTELTNLIFVAGGAAPGNASFSAEAGTTYSISVDSVSSQSAGVVRLAIWPLPLNDEFANRYQITGTNITVTGTNAEATSEPGEMLLGVGNTLWWSWIAPETGRVQLGFADDGTVAEVFTGDSLTNLTLVASNPNTNELTFLAVAGNTYQISLDTASNSTSSIVSTTLTQTSEPPNDGFKNAVILSGSHVQTTGTNLGATLEPGEPSPGGSNAASVWWKWTAPATQQMTISTSGTSFDTVFGIYTGSALTNLTLIEAGTNIGSFAVVSNTTYFIDVAGVDGAMGYINLSLTPTPPNDDFTHRQLLKGYSVFASGNNTGATEELGEGIYAVDPSGASVWFSWVAPASGTVNITYTGNEFFPALEVFTGSAISNLVYITENSFFNPLSFTASAGTTYQIVLVGYYGGTGDYTLDLSLNAGAKNDNFANRIALAGTNLTVAADNTGATRQTGEPNPGGVAGGHSLWWSYTAPAAGSVLIDFSQTGFVPVIGIYTGTQLSTLKTVTNVTDYVKDQVVFNTIAGVSYQIMVDGYKGGFGNILLNLNFQPAPPNDAFRNRIALTGGSFSVSGNNRGATEQPGEPRHAGLPGSHSVWWSWLAPSSQTVTLNAEGDGFEPHLAVYTGSRLTNLLVVTNNYNGRVLASGVTFAPIQGDVYQIAVDSDFVDFGDITRVDSNACSAQ